MSGVCAVTCSVQFLKVFFHRIVETIIGSFFYKCVWLDSCLPYAWCVHVCAMCCCYFYDIFL